MKTREECLDMCIDKLQQWFWRMVWSLTAFVALCVALAFMSQYADVEPWVASCGTGVVGFAIGSRFGFAHAAGVWIGKTAEELFGDDE